MTDQGALLDSIFGPDPGAPAPRPIPAGTLVGAIDLMASGPAVLSIPDAEGEMVPYRASAVTPERSTWAIRLERADGRGEPYRVSLERDGRWVCECRDRKYRRREKPHGCKHIAMCRALWSVLAPLLLYEQEDGRYSRWTNPGPSLPES